jgi:hypothetical protein
LKVIGKAGFRRHLRHVLPMTIDTNVMNDRGSSPDDCKKGSDRDQEENMHQEKHIKRGEVVHAHSSRREVGAAGIFLKWQNSQKAVRTRYICRGRSFST